MNTRRLDRAQDRIDWLERGISEWRAEALSKGKQAEASRATARIAIEHLFAVLSDDSEKQKASARDWLVSIGYSIPGKVQ